jgi:hypothetical protein
MACVGGMPHVYGFQQLLMTLDAPDRKWQSLNLFRLLALAFVLNAGHVVHQTLGNQGWLGLVHGGAPCDIRLTAGPFDNYQTELPKIKP